MNAMEQEESLLNKSEKVPEQLTLVINNFPRDANTNPVIKKSAIRQVCLGLIANFTCVAPSMSLGFSAILLPYLLDENNPYRLTESQSSWIASVAPVATPLGCFLSGPIADRFGRKKAFITAHIVTCVGWLTIAIAYQIPESQYPILIVGRLITGVSTGLVSMTSNVYMAEISSAKLRGMFTTWSACSFSVGVLVVYVLGYVNKENWFLTAVITAAFPIVGIILVQLFVIESPTWLISRGQIANAKANMCHLFSTTVCTPEVLHEINTIISTKQRIQAEIAARYAQLENPSKIAVIRSNLKYFTGRTCLKPFVLMLMFFFFQQFTGIFVVIFYAVNIIVEAGITIDAFVAAVIVALTRLIASIAVGFISRKYGRRPPSIISGAGMTICMITLGIYVLAKANGYISEEKATNLSWLPMILLLAYFCTSTLGFLTMPFAMSAEVFPSRVRATATGLLTCIAYTFNFITVKIFPNMVDGMGMYGVFLFYGVVSLFGTLFVIIFLPETKGKTLEEIEEYFGRSKKQGSDRQNGKVIEARN